MHERVSAMNNGARRPLEWDWYRASRAALPCAVCREPMQPLRVRDVSIDRCAQHGVWFDRHELGELLFRVAQPPAKGTAGSSAAVDAVGDIGASSIGELVLYALGALFAILD